MADEIIRTIYKLELDDSGYSKGLESLTASTTKLSQSQDAANKKLQEAEAALKRNADQIAATKKVIEENSTSLGKNASAQDFANNKLTSGLKKLESEQIKLNEIVAQSRKEYDLANKSAQDFANNSAKASQLQQQSGGGRFPVPGAPTIAPPVIPQIVPPAAFEDFNLADILGGATDEFEQLRVAIGLAEQRMSELNAEDEEFKELAGIVTQGRIALDEFDNAAKKSGQSTLSLRGQIRQGRDELVRLEEAGKGATKEYIELEQKVAKLTDAFGDQQARIKILASDTRALDFGKAAIQSATNAFSIYTSVSILAGNENEELQKKTMQLFAAMQLLTSLEQLSIQLKRGGVLATNAQTAAQAAYTAVVGASTGALKVFRLALIGSGIGAVIIGIALLVKHMNDLKKAQEESANKQRILNDINKEAIKGYTEEVTHLELIRTKLNDLSIPQSKRVELAKEYNKIADEGNKLDVTQIGNIDLLNAAIDRQIGKIKARAQARAAENVITAKSEEVFLQTERATREAEQFLATQNLPTITEEELAKSGPVIGLRTRLQRIQDFIEEDPALQKAKKDLQDALNVAGNFINVDDLIKPPPKKEPKGTKEIENVFEQEKLKLQQRLAELRNEEIQNIQSINNEFAAKLNVEKKRIADLLSDKKVTPTQAKILVQMAIDVNKAENDKALADFNKKVTDARNKLNDELTDLQSKNTLDTLNLIQDEFNRRAALIDFNEKKEIERSQQSQQDRLDALDLNSLLLSEADFEAAKAIIIQEGEIEALNIQRKFAGERQTLAADSYKKILDTYTQAIEAADLVRDEGIATLVRNVSDRFLQGKISYEQFQKEITQIQRNAESERRNLTLEVQRKELADLDAHLAAITDKTTKEYQELLRIREELRKKIAAGEKEDATKDAEDTNADDSSDNRLQKINEYVSAIGSLADSVIGFWQKANEAEAAALDRSIALQEQRVNAAQRIAARGNAEYLKAEEDRLKELQVQRENAARRQLAVDAALQASQILVGITGAIAKISTGVGAAATIAEIAVIIGALATGYGLVKSLQGNQPRLAKGTKRVKREGHPAGIDTIPAWLSEDEAVIPADKNRAYHPAISAIYDGTIPPDVMNKFVKEYKLKPVSLPNYQKIKDVAELHISQDGKLAVVMNEQNKLLKENNDLHRTTIRALKSMGVNVNMDKNGIAVSVMEVVEKLKTDKRV